MTDVETLLRQAMSEHSSSLPLRPDLASSALRGARRRTRINRAIAVAASVSLVAGSVGVWAGIEHRSPQQALPTTSGPRVVVPDVSRGYLTDIQHRLCDAGLKPQIVSAPKVTRAGTEVNGYVIIKSTPAAGGQVPAGSVVRLELGISENAGGIGPSAPAFSKVPKVQGMDVDHALSALTALGYLVDITVEIPADGLQIGAQTPDPGVRLKRGATVTLVAGSAYDGACNPNL